MQDRLNSIMYTSTIVPDNIRKNMLMKKVLAFVHPKEEHPELTKPQLCKMIGISDSNLKRIMKDLNMKSFYRHEVPVNKKKTDLAVNKKINKGAKKLYPSARASLSSKGGFVYPNEVSEVEKAPIINYDSMINSDKTTSLFNNKPKKVLSEGALNRVKKDLKNCFGKNEFFFLNKII